MVAKPVNRANLSPKYKGLGYIKLPRGCSVRPNANPFVTSLRKLFRERKDLHTNHDTMATVPARNSELTHMFQFMSTLEGAIHIKDMDPKIISKIFYMVKIMGYGIDKPSDVSLKYYKDNISDTYLRDCKGNRYNKFETAFDEGDKFLTMVECGGNCTDEIMTIITDHVNQYGGFDAYCKLNSTLRPDAMSCIKYANGKCAIEPCGLVPVKVCQVCNAVNVYSHYELTPSQIHGSLRHLDVSKSAVPSNRHWDQDQLTNLDNPDDPLSVPWRCCSCFSDLNLAVTGLLMSAKILFQKFWEFCFKIAGQLDELLKCGYGDVYDDLDAQKKNNIKEQDMRTITEFFLHLRRKIVPCGHDLDPITIKNLSKTVGGAFFKPESKLNSIKPELVAEISILRESMRQMYIGDNVAIIGDILPHDGSNTLHQWYHDNSLFPPSSSGYCQSNVACNHEQEMVMLGGVGISGQSLNNVLDTVDAQRCLPFIVVNRTDTNTLADQTGQFYIKDDTIELYLDGNPVPWVFRKDTYNSLTKYDLLAIKDSYYLISTVKQLNLVSLKCLTGPYKDIKELPTFKANYNLPHTITLPLPSIDKLFGGWNFLSYQSTSIDLDPSLFRYLCVRNVSGKVSHDTLKEWAVGFALRRFVVHNKVISNPQVTYELIDIHVILSRICMMVMRQKYSVNDKLKKFLRKLGPVKELVTTIDPLLTGMILMGFSDYFKSKFGFSLGELAKLFKNSHISSWLQGISQKNFWEDLLSLTGEHSHGKLKVQKLDEMIEDEDIGLDKSCKHHIKCSNHDSRDYSNHCKCCNYKITNSDYCVCCKPSHINSEIIYEPRDWGTSKEKTTESRNLFKTTKKGRISLHQNVIDQLENEVRLIMQGVHAQSQGLPSIEATAEMREAEQKRYAALFQRSRPIIHQRRATQDTKGKKGEQGSTQPNPNSTDEYDNATKSAAETGQQTDSQTTKETPLIADTAPADQNEVSADVEPVIKFTPTMPKNYKSRLDRLKDDVNEALASQKSHAVYLKYFDIEFTQHVIDPVVSESIWNENQSFKYWLPHCPGGITILPAGVYEIVKSYPLTNSGYLTCGIDSYNYVMETTHSNGEFARLCNSNAPYANFDLIKVAELTKRNLLLIQPDSTFLCKYDDTTDEFGCIEFQTPQDPEGVGHFQPCKVERKSINRFYLVYKDPFRLSDRAECYTKLTGLKVKINNLYNITAENNLMTELMIARGTEHFPGEGVLSNLEIVEHLGKKYLTNNKLTMLHQVDRDFIHVQIPNYLIGKIHLLKTALDGKLTMNDLPATSHNPEGLPLYWESALLETFYEQLRIMTRIYNCQHSIEQSYIKSQCTGVLKPWFARSKFSSQSISSLKLKKYDVVPFKPDGSSKIVMLNVLAIEKGICIIDKKMSLEVPGKLYEVKESFGSAVRAVISLMQEPITMHEFNQILNNSTTTLGPAGYGKSTDIAKNYQPGDLCVALTSTSVRSLKDKIQGNGAVMSVEKALFSHKKAGNNLYIDECTMLDWMSVLLMCTPTTKLHMYGSRNQVGYIDMSLTAGVRHSKDIVSMVPKSTIKNANHTYRIGSPLLEFLEPLEPNWTNPIESKTTKYDITVLNDDAIELICVMAKRVKPDVIITVYNQNKAKLIEALRKTNVNVPVVTTHSFQGQEVKRSIVVLMPDWSNKWGLNGDDRYLNSALTRASEYVNIVVCNYTKTTITSVNDLRNQIGGKNLVNLVTNHVILPGQDSGTSPNPSSLDKLQLTTLNTMHKLTKEEVELINNLELEMGGVNLTYTHFGTGVQCEARKMGMTIATIKNENGLITVDTKIDLVRDRIMESLDKCLEIPDEKRLLIQPGNLHYECYLEMRTVNKLRELIWIIDKTQDGCLELNVLNEKFTMQKSFGCPLMAGLTIKRGDKYLTISNGWGSLQKRTIDTNITTTDIEFLPFQIWLQLPTTGEQPECNMDLGWLKHLTGEMATTYWQVKERLTKLHIWMLNLMYVDDKPRCKVLNRANTVKYNRIMRKFSKKESIEYHQSVIPHKTLIYTTAGWWGKFSYSLASEEGNLIDIKPDSTDKQISEFIMEALDDMNSTTETPGIRGNIFENLEIPGMIVSLDQHIRDGDMIKSYVMNQLTELKLLTENPGKDLIRLERSIIDVYKKDINDKFPNMVITSSNYELLDNPIDHVLEQIIVNMYGRLGRHSDELILYAGSIPLTIAIQQKYYIKLREPDKSEHSRIAYDKQVLTIDSLVRHMIKNNQNVVPDIRWDGESKPKRLILGNNAICIPTATLNDLLNQAEETYAWVPSQNKASKKYFVMNEDLGFLSYVGSEFTKPIKNELIHYSRTGAPMNVDVETRSYHQCETVTEFLFHRLVRIRKKTLLVGDFITTCVGTNQDLYGYTHVKLPWFDMNFVSIVENGKLIIMKDLKVSKPLLRNMLLRLATGDDSEDAILAYARTLESTQVISQNHIQSMYNTDLNVLLNTSWLAFYIHNDYLTKFKLLINIVNAAHDRPYLLHLIENMLHGFLKISQVGSDLLEKLTKPLLERIVETLTYRSTPLSEGINKLSLDWIQYKPKRTFIHYKLDGRGMGATWHMPKDDNDDGDGDEDKQGDATSKHQQSEEQGQNGCGHDDGMHEDESENKVDDDGQETQDHDGPPDSESKGGENNLKSMIISNPESSMTQKPVDAINEEDENSHYDTADEDNESLPDVGVSEIDELYEADINETAFKNLKTMVSSSMTHLVELMVELVKSSGIEEYYQLVAMNAIMMLMVKGKLDTKQELIETIEFFQWVIEQSLHANYKMLYRLWCIKYNSHEPSKLNEVKIETKLCMETKSPTRPMRCESNDNFIPKLIWTYWNDEKIPDFIQRCIMSWHKYNDDYRIVVITNTSIKDYVSKDLQIVLEKQTVEFRSDWIRLALLKDMGGIWIDASSICQESLNPYVDHTLNSKSLIFQPCLGKRSDKNKSYESWFIISAVKNRIMNRWYQVTTDMMLNSEPNGANSIDYLRSKYSDNRFDHCFDSVTPHLRTYLRVYITEKIALELEGHQEPQTMCADEGQLTRWHDLTYTQWIKLWDIYAGQPKTEYPIDFPVVKLIGSVRNWLLADYMEGKTINPDSHFGELNNLETIPYNVKDCTKLDVIQQGNLTTSYKEKLVHSKRADVMLICIGSTGDILPFIHLHDMLCSNGCHPVLVTHKDKKSLIGSRFAAYLSVDSDELMNMANEILNKSNLLMAPRGFMICKRIFQDLEEIMDLYAGEIRLYIYNPMVPCTKHLKERYGSIWRACNPFPSEWVSGSRPKTSVIGTINDMIIKTIMSWSDELIGLRGDQDKINKKPFEERETLYTMPEILLRYEDGGIQVGPLTFGGYAEYNKLTNHPIKNVCAIMFSSCQQNIELTTLTNLATCCINHGYFVMLIDSSGTVSPGSKLYKLSQEYTGKFVIQSSINLETMVPSGKFVICHGGIGTVTDCILNGLVPFVYPTIADQTEWGARLEELQIGAVLDRNNLEESLGRSIMSLGKLKTNVDKVKLDLRNNLMQLRSVLSHDLLTKNLRVCNRADVSFGYQLLSTDDYNIEASYPDYTIFPFGIYEILRMNSGTTFDPTCGSHCVKQVLQYYLSRKGLEKLKSSPCGSIAGLLADAVTYDNLLNGLVSMGMNFYIIHPKKPTVCVNCFEGPILGIEIIIQDGQYHCRAVKNIGVPHTIPEPPIARAGRFYETALSYLRNTFKVTRPLREVCDPCILMYNHRGNHLKNYIARIKANGLTALSSRGAWHGKLIKLTRDAMCYRAEINESDKSLSVFLVLGTHNWITVTGFIKDGFVYLWNDDVLPSMTIIIDLHLTLPTYRQERLIIKQTKYVSLNRETITYCKAANKTPRSDQLPGPLIKDCTLIISHYDNRSHHKHDEEAILKLAKDVIFITDNVVTMKALMDTRDKHINRLCIQNGRTAWATEFGDTRLAQYMERINPNALRLGSSILTSDALPDSRVNYIEFNTRLVNQKNVYLAEDFLSEAVTSKIELINKVRDLSLPNHYLEALLEELNNLSSETFLLENSLRVEGSIVHVGKTIATMSKRLLLIPGLKLTLSKGKRGGTDEEDIDSARMVWRQTPLDQASKSGDWWGLETKSPSSADKVPSMRNVMAFNTMTIHNWEGINYNLTGDVQEVVPNLELYIAPYNTTYTGHKLEPLYDFIPGDVIDLWENTDLTSWLSLYAPINKATIFSREDVGKIKNLEKHTMVRYPLKSRPVLTKVCFEEGRSIIGRLKSVAFIRTKTPDPRHLALSIADTYFRTDWRAICTNYKHDPIIIDHKEVEEWIRLNKDCPKIVAELILTLSGEILTKPINDVNIHLKLESLLKSEPINMWQKQQARIIVWQRKSICAIYSSAFKQIKVRLKEILHRKVIYADGLRPDELSARARLCSNVRGFFENDLTKQDRQTDKPIIDTEMYLYDLLGLHPNLISAWKEMHETWRFKSKNYWGTGESMRLTGQATTAIGNCLTNLQVHQEFVKQNWTAIELALFLGDDMCMVFNRKPNIKNLKNDIACKFNMQSKESWNVSYGNFCSMLLSRLPANRCELCPDVVRLHHRYTVTNGVHEVTPQNVWMRKASYLMMLGNLPEVKRTVELLSMPIQPVHWYDYHSMLESVATKYNMNHNQVEGYLDNLLHTIRHGQLYTHNFRIFGSV